jgi:5-epi-alpha-selinene synthase
MGQAYPYTTRERLLLIADFNTWLFTLDDRFDEGALGRDPAALHTLHRECLAIMRGAPVTTSSDPWLSAVADLRERFLSLSTPTWWESFVSQLERSYAASRWEARNRLEQRVPTEPAYRRMRRYTGAVYVFLDLIEFAQGIELPRALAVDPLILALRRKANNVICWFNDIVSLEKELRAGDMHNYALVIHHQRGVSLADAIDRVVEMHNREAASFERAQLRRHTVVRRGANATDLIEDHYIDALALWIRANYDWSLATIRYRR